MRWPRRSRNCCCSGTAPTTCWLSSGQPGQLSMRESPPRPRRWRISCVTRPAAAFGSCSPRRRRRPRSSAGRGGTLSVALQRRLKAMAARKGAQIVDLFTEVPASLVGQDGLHLTEEGYQRVADVFLQAIEATYEMAAGPDCALTRRYLASSYTSVSPNRRCETAPRGARPSAAPAPRHPARTLR